MTKQLVDEQKELVSDAPPTRSPKMSLEELQAEKERIAALPKSMERDAMMQKIRARIRKAGGHAEHATGPRPPRAEGEPTARQKRIKKAPKVSKGENQVTILENRISEAVLLLRPWFGKEMPGEQVYAVFRVLSPAIVTAETTNVEETPAPEDLQDEFSPVVFEPEAEAEEAPAS